MANKFSFICYTWLDNSLLYAFHGEPNLFYMLLVESPRIRGIKSLHVDTDVLLTENIFTYHLDINADLNTASLM